MGFDVFLDFDVVDGAERFSDMDSISAELDGTALDVLEDLVDVVVTPLSADFLEDLDDLARCSVRWIWSGDARRRRVRQNTASLSALAVAAAAPSNRNAGREESFMAFRWIELVETDLRFVDASSS